MGWNNDKGPRIAFLGTGAQGASIAADFAMAGLNVTFIDQWPDHVEAIRKNGITVNLPKRTINVEVPALHLCQIAEIKEPFDVVFLVVKAYDTKWACEMIKPVLARDGLIVGLQNGMTHEDIAAILGRERTIGAVIEIASNMWVPGITNRQNDVDESWFALGALDPKTQDRVEVRGQAAAQLRARRSDGRHPLREMDEACRQRRRTHSLGDRQSASQ